MKFHSLPSRVTGFEDWLPTILELAGAKESTPSDIDGISFAPTLLGRTQPERPFLYREAPGYDGQQCVRIGKLEGDSDQSQPKSGRDKPGAGRNRASTTWRLIRPSRVTLPPSVPRSSRGSRRF